MIGSVREYFFLNYIADTKKDKYACKWMYISNDLINGF